MIVNSHPYNPASHQQLCQPIGVQNNNNHQNTATGQQPETMNRSGPMIEPYQQNNSLYESNFANDISEGNTHSNSSNNNNNFSRSNGNNQTNNTNMQTGNQHMLDLANLQQGIDARHQRLASNQQQQTGNQDLLYSPSSSTSLLYHIYDQINLPAENGRAFQPNLSQPKKGPQNGTNTMTILNPANLFGGSQGAAQTCYPDPYRGQQQQPSPYPSAYHSHSQQASFAGDASMEQALIRHQQQQQQQQQQQFSRSFHANTLRPLSSSSSSATSGQNITYSRQARQQPASNLVIGKSHSNLASILHQASNGSTQTGSSTTNTLSTHLGALDGAGKPFGSTVGQVLADLYATNPANLGHLGHLHPGSTLHHHAHAIPHLAHLQPQYQTHQYSNSNSGKRRSFSDVVFGGSSMVPLRRLKQRLHHAGHQNQLVLVALVVVVLFGVGLISTLKWWTFSSTMAGSAPNFQSTNVQVSPLMISNNNNNNQQLSSSPNIPNNIQQQQSAFFYPPLTKAELATTGRPLDEQPEATGSGAQQPGQDGLKSRLIFGDFVILSQNFSSNQKTALSERIVKLMDQVFLSTDVKRFYSRMEVTNIRPQRANSAGILVDCVIVLSHSTAYAAQQFGIALYESLSRSADRLAGQPSYLIDKNSIRFNTVPDRDLRAGLVPPSLVSTTLLQELLTSGEQAIAAPPSAIVEPINHPRTLSSNTESSSTRQVVWSEWSQWSSCLDKNGICDPMRVHSRARNCVAQHTGENVPVDECKARFDPLDRHFDIEGCSLTCSGSSSSSGTLTSGPGDGGLMSDAPSVLPGGAAGLASPLQTDSPGLPKPPMASAATASGLTTQEPAELVGSTAAASNSPVNSKSEQLPSSSEASLEQPATSGMPQLNQLGGVSCSNCTSDEICLLLVSQKVPFCAKVRDRQDDSGCGGWCRAQSQLCQPVGANAFKCIHDSECLAEEWRCHDSGCIPLSKRCDGHSNCYDSSDERDCPA